MREHQTQPLVNDLQTDADTLIYVEGPHSWYYGAKKRILSDDDYKLIKTIYSNGVPVSYIYGSNSVYTDGKLLCDE